MSSSAFRDFFSLGAGVTPAQGSTKPTVGFVTIKFPSYLNATDPGAKICSSSVTKVCVGVTR
jgi:hypothetical protein